MFEIFSHLKPLRLEGLSSNLFYFKDFRHLLSAGLDLLFPPRCLICKTDPGSMIEPTLCAPCFVQHYDPQTLKIPRTTSIAHACGRYEGVLRNLLMRTKFKSDPLPIPFLTRLLQENVIHLPNKSFDCVTFVPADVKRLRNRGFHFTAYLAKVVSKSMGIPLEQKLLVRTRSIHPQQTLNKAERAQNVAKAFTFSHPCVGMKILVVDDVYTTGATASEITRTLLDAGAHKVMFLVLAHTPDFC